MANEGTKWKKMAILINLNDARKKLNELEGSTEYNKGVTDAFNALFDLQTIEAEPRWIPCSERLPEKSGRYLVTRGLNACDAVWNRVYIINYSDLMGLKSERIWWDGNVGKSDFKRIDDVTAWMPLPNPYREVEE